MSNTSRKEKATQLYAFVLTLYPQGYRQTFGSQMLQTFKDHYTDSVESGKQARAHFWFDVVSDEAKGVIREQFAALKENRYMTNIWVKQGLLFGMMLGVIHIGYDLINNLAPANLTLNSLLNNGLPFAVLLFTGIGGYVAARKTGQIKPGIYTGLFVGLSSIVIGMIALFIITFSFMDIIRQNAFILYDFHRSGLKNIDQFIIEDALGATFVGIFFSLLAGGIFGIVGGYIGKTLKGREKYEQ